MNRYTKDIPLVILLVAFCSLILFAYSCYRWITGSFMHPAMETALMFLCLLNLSLLVKRRWLYISWTIIFSILVTVLTIVVIVMSIDQYRSMITVIKFQKFVYLLILYVSSVGILVFMAARRVRFWYRQPVAMEGDQEMPSPTTDDTNEK